jgi:hypothetical protein
MKILENRGKNMLKLDLWIPTVSFLSFKAKIRVFQKEGVFYGIIIPKKKGCFMVAFSKKEGVFWFHFPKRRGILWYHVQKDKSRV